METRLRVKKTIEFSLFKSYYVVWKQSATVFLGKYPTRLFKSYYVVWKLFFLRERLNYQIRLNRTM